MVLFSRGNVMLECLNYCGDLLLEDVFKFVCTKTKKMITIINIPSTDFLAIHFKNPIN
ncbi:Uncharacterised protein [Bacillus freudenreichii]|nr:Uncharacterised protein [Bacillus freudenreichii]